MSIHKEVALDDCVRQLEQLVSMSRKGNPYDTATTESFFKTLRVEKVYLREYRTLENVRVGFPFSFVN